MKHEDIRELLLKYIDGEATIEESEKVEEHLVDCKECQEEYEELKTVLSLFNTLEPMEPPEGLKRSIMAKIKSESLPPKPWFSSIKNGWVSWGAAAAIVIIVVGTMSMPDLLSNMGTYVSDANNKQTQEIMPAGFGIEHGIRIENGDTPMGALAGASVLRDERADIRGLGITDEEDFQHLPVSREVLSLAVVDLDASLEYIKNLVDDPIIRMENEWEAIILIETARDEGQFMESLEELGAIRVENFYNTDCIEEFSSVEIEICEFLSDINEDLYNEDEEQRQRLPRDLESVEWQAADINALEIEDVIMYEIRISVQEE